MRVVRRLRELSISNLVVILAVLFFLSNSFWVLSDNRLPMIGDDARFLQGTYELYTPVAQGDFEEAWDNWQNMFIHPDRFPRTPLFAALSVPTFLIFGVSENAAIFTNLAVLATNSYLIMLLVRELFPKLPRRKYAAAVLGSVLAYNLLPGVFSFGRLYMSETLQTFFVLLMSWMLIKYKKTSSPKVFLALGFILGLSWLLRYIMPLYLVVPLAVFGWQQIRQKESPGTYIKRIAAVLLGFVPVALTWYGQNFETYTEFARFTSSGELSQYYSLGPVFSLRTIGRFWYVIVTWMFGWPFMVFSFVTGGLWALFFGRNSFGRVVEFIKDRKLSLWERKDRLAANPIVYLALIPVPTLLALTLSDGKTARYFVPVMIFWVILVAVKAADLAFSKKTAGKVWMKILLVAALLPVAYIYDYTVLRFLPALPLTGQSPAARPWDGSMESAAHERYDFFYEVFEKNMSSDGSLRIYNTAEQPQFNDAELIWYGTERGYHLFNTHEFSRYSDVDEGRSQINGADVVIVESTPEVGELWEDKYRQIREYVTGGDRFVLLSERAMSDGSEMQIFITVN
ncbi:MAG: ArnT family glycosyltransferase [Candidatus Dojkabacteria bacterium]